MKVKADLLIPDLPTRMNIVYIQFVNERLPVYYFLFGLVLTCFIYGKRRFCLKITAVNKMIVIFSIAMKGKYA